MRARRGGFGRVVVVVVRYIYLYIKERKKLDVDVCLGERPPFPSRTREKEFLPQNNSRTQQTNEGGDNRIFEEEMRLFRVIFFSLVFFYFC